MPVLERGEVLDTTNPKVTFYGITTGPESFQAGLLTDVDTLEFQVFDISTPAKLVNPVQVYPGSGRAVVNLTTDKLGTGRYVAAFTVPADEPLGRHEVRFFYKVAAADPERSERCEVEVVEGLSAFQSGPLYAFVADLKDEGVCGKTDAFLLQRINLASRIVERITGRLFAPEYQAINVDGMGSRTLLLEQPIVAIEQVLWETSPYFPSSLEVDANLLRVYSRHLSQGLFQPDDRNNPKLELWASREELLSSSPDVFFDLIFPRGHQNIIVKGVFGYTERNGRACGGVPAPIRHVTKLLVMRELDKLAETAKRDDALKRYRLTSEKTRDQSYTLEALSASRRTGAFTGDPDIDTILASYVRPPRCGTA